MRKRWMIGLTVIFTMLLLSGCGEMTLEEKAAKVQKANTITTQDVIDLMELEGLQVETVTPSDTFRNQWPNGVLVKVNGKHYLAMQSFDENLYQREKVLNDIGWDNNFFNIIGESKDEVPNVLVVVGRDHINYDDGRWVYATTFYGKNIVAYMIYDYSEVYTAATQEEMLKVTEEINAVKDPVSRVFYKDINQLITEEIAVESENFKITGTLSYYQTGVTDEQAKREITYYDAKTWFQGEIVCSDAVWEQYQGEAYEVTLERPDEWEYGSGKAMIGSTLEYEDKKMDIPNGTTEEILWSEAQGAPIYVLTIQIGDITETFRLEPNNV